MKKVLFIVAGLAVLAACSSAPKQVGINAVPEKLTTAITKADRFCSVNTDCVAVQKGCCECAGYAAVSVKSAEKIKKIWQNECQNAPCTREMCYVQIEPECQQGICVGKPKTMDSYFGR